MDKKKYRINEIFYSLQGEGKWAGRAAVFIRFSGCNLKCPFCDTDFEEYTEMTLSEIIDIVKPWEDCGFIVLTGGEPMLQIDKQLLCKLHGRGFYIAVESNGTRKPSNEVMEWIDWVTISPKTAYVKDGSVAMEFADEIKVVYDGEKMPSDFGIRSHHHYVQPCDTGDAVRNAKILNDCVEWVKEHPRWRLSLQQQKILNVK